MTECKHTDAFWYCNREEEESVNEDGWYCTGCEKTLGYCPDLDKLLIHVKAHSILTDLVDAGIIHISSGTEGLGFASRISDKCRELQCYDKYTICKIVFDFITPSHAEFWKKQSSLIKQSDKTGEKDV